MKLAIMQPYFFPYIGYFQLINAVDKFVLYDDVNYIKKGWVNRNKIMINGEPNLFTVPIKDVSQHTLIKDVEIVDDYKWKMKFQRTIERSYKKALYFENTFYIVNDVINTKSKFLCDWIRSSILLINDYLNIQTEIIESSKIYNNSELKGQNRIIDICRKENADIYINPIGGQEIYSKPEFKKNNIELRFLKTGDIKYKQFDNDFISFLSIIDVMMFNSIEKTIKMLGNYNLI